MTVTLLQSGAYELNPFMASLIQRSVTLFAILKMGLTGAGIFMMVILARYRFLRLLRVEWALYGVLIAYAVLITYELWMLKASVYLPIL